MQRKSCASDRLKRGTGLAIRCDVERAASKQQKEELLSRTTNRNTIHLPQIARMVSRIRLNSGIAPSRPC